ncbi:PDR/VanB family oxidoreductase [Aurantimonas sp. 22II-16-19i]|uniref:PDR/VanB family oxidoreductase n=1 Tax=Aurantimonas sp. 22II-16-19i TaxID=1317114 RepID=UPI001FDA730C|nr:PDR/VanB family oxidoreductase [Aurantimonas sp. 22II-16-19i]
MIMKLRLAGSQPIASDVRLLRMVHPRRPQLPPWQAGSHVDVHLPEIGVRQYSLCGDPADTSSYTIAVKLEPGGRGGSRWMHRELAEGAQVHVSAPRNHFPLLGGDGRVVLIGGGIGITPLAAMAYTLVAEGSDFVFHYCARDEDRAPLLKELRELCGDRLRVWLSSQDNRFDPVSTIAREAGAEIYACGPERLVGAVSAAALAAAHPENRLHTERFTALADADFTREPFEVVLGRSSRRLVVPADRSLLAVLEENGVGLESSCEIGVCGACECGYLEGDVIHRDVVLSPTQRKDRMMPCVSRARGRLTLDV